MLFSYFIFLPRKQHHPYPTLWGISLWELQQMISAPYLNYPSLSAGSEDGMAYVGRELLLPHLPTAGILAGIAVGKHPCQGSSGSKQMPPTLTSLWFPSGDSQSHPHPSISSSNPVLMDREKLPRSRVFVADNDWDQVWNFQVLKKHSSKELLEKSVFLKGRTNVPFPLTPTVILLKLLELVLNCKHCLQEPLFS